MKIILIIGIAWLLSGCIGWVDWGKAAWFGCKDNEVSVPTRHGMFGQIDRDAYCEPKNKKNTEK